MLLAMPAAVFAARPVTFNLSTAKTFAPGEKPTIHLYSQNVFNKSSGKSRRDGKQFSSTATCQRAHVSKMSFQFRSAAARK